MPRPATGQVVERRTREGVTSYALRFRVPGRGRQYLHLGYSPHWTRRRAETELADVMADVRRGRWEPPDRTPPEAPREMQTFHEFSSDWFARRQLEGLRPRTLEYLRWTLTDHLLPHFAAIPLDRITVEEVDRYSRAKVAEGCLSNSSVNKTLQTLTAVMEVAVEYGHVPTNPAKGRRRRLPADRPQRQFLEPGQVTALLDGAGQLDAEARDGRRFRRALLATLAFAGLRISELLALRWRDVSLADGTLRVRQSKTSAGVRTVDVQPELRDELAALKARARKADPDDLVFPTSTGKPDNRNNVRRRVLLRAVERANAGIEAAGEGELLPDGLSPHALRRSFASWLVAEGEDAAYVMEQLGHTDPQMTLGLYAKALRSKRRRPHVGRAVHAAPGAADWAPMGTTGADAVFDADPSRTGRPAEPAR